MNLDAQLVSRLKQPLAGESPAGVVLHSTPEVYRPFRNTLNLARSSFRALEQNPEPEQLDELRSTNNHNWQQVSELIVKLLEEQTRDLDLLGWLLYSQLFTEAPFQALQQCLNLIRELLETYGASLRPPGDAKAEQEQKQTAATAETDTESTDTEQQSTETSEAESQQEPSLATSCNSSDWIKKLKICQQIIGDVSGDGLVHVPLRIAPLIGPMTLLDYQHSASRGQMEALGKKARSALKQDKDGVIANIVAIQDSVSELKKIELTLSEYCTDGASSHLLNTQPLQSCLGESLNATRSLLGQLLRPWPGEEIKATEKSSDSGNTEKDTDASEKAGSGAGLDFDVSGNVVAGYIQSQEHALETIRALSSFFRQTQPYSPVSYILEKALRMAQLTLPEFLQEVINNDTSILGNIYLRAGLDLPDKNMPVSDTPFAAAAPSSYDTPENDPPEEESEEEDTSTDAGSDTTDNSSFM
ncbi:type VI secretion system protein TssA [Endozoicomonadaceae bacterium StTr2]